MNRKIRGLAFSVTGAALLLAALAATNVLSQFFYARFDFSSGKVYSISDGTRAVLDQIKDTLLVKVYYTPRLPPPYGLQEQYLKDLLGEYKSSGRGRLKLEFINPDTPERQREAQSAGIAPVQINVMARDKFEVKEAYMGAVFLYKGRTETLPVLENTAGLEYDLTRRIKKLTVPQMKTLGLVGGHGEKTGSDPGLQHLFQGLSEQMNIETVSLDKPLPAKLDALWLLGPTQPLKSGEIERLKAWVNAGRPLGLLLNRRAVNLQAFYAMPQESGLSALLQKWGLDLREGFVVDAQSERIQMETQYGMFVAMRIQEYPFLPVATQINREHPATRRIDAVTLPFVHPLKAAAVPASPVKFTSLVESSRASWHHTGNSIQPGQPLEKLESADKGPFSLAGVLEGDFYKLAPSTVAATEAGADKAAAGRVVVVGTAYQLHQNLANKASNIAFLMNLIEWSLQDESLLSIRAKGFSFRPLRRLSDFQRSAAKYGLIFFLPALLLLSGSAFYYRQRSLRARLPGLYADNPETTRTHEPAASSHA
ncbi:MAG: GldG family protein [Elusimicrobia bacterium]|nr:GldG family protein [Elusimicrobiota bacterium]